MNKITLRRQLDVTFLETICIYRSRIIGVYKKRVQSRTTFKSVTCFEIIFLLLILNTFTGFV